jgi:hypothetical protein
MAAGEDERLSAPVFLMVQATRTVDKSSMLLPLSLSTTRMTRCDGIV